MAGAMPRSHAALFELSRQALGTTQVGLGQMYGVARRTAQRWAHSGMPSHHLPDLALRVHPHDPELAAEIALAAGTTLDALGIGAPASLPPSAQATVPSPPPHSPSIVDAVVCAAAETMDLSPRVVRAGLHAAFARAQELGLDVPTVERALRARPNKPSRS
jgi:hypothetical protein